MKDRITQFLAHEGISPAEFADKIGVQRSSVSHVLNGRNYPSASFIQKMLVSYKALNPRWLLLGEGTMFETKSIHAERTLFQFPDANGVSNAPKEEIPVAGISRNDANAQKTEIIKDHTIKQSGSNIPAETNLPHQILGILDNPLSEKEVERVVLFFKDKTFTAYTPSK